MPYVHSSLIPYAYVAQTFSLRSTDAQTKSLCYKVRLETISTVVIRVKDKALRTSYFLYRAHITYRNPLLDTITQLSQSQGF